MQLISTYEHGFPRRIQAYICTLAWAYVVILLVFNYRIFEDHVTAQTVYTLNICNIISKLCVIFIYVNVYLFPCQSSQVYIQWLLIYCHQTGTKKTFTQSPRYFTFCKNYSIKVTYVVIISYHTSFPAPEMRDSSVTSASHLTAATIYIIFLLF